MGFAALQLSDSGRSSLHRCYDAQRFNFPF